MSKVNKQLAILIFLLILVVLAGTVMKTPVGTKTSVKELKVAGLSIQFEDGVSESEVKAILESHNLTMDYSINYNTDDISDKYYIMLDTDNWDVRRELTKEMKKEKKRLDCIFSCSSYQKRRLPCIYGI